VVADVISWIVDAAQDLKPVVGEKPLHESAGTVLLSMPSLGAEVMATNANRADFADHVSHAPQRESLCALNIYL
jgi:hypothetical protein